ncbi:MAG: hypothetical protein AABX93_02570 [Nanoarchaeota archaeon]
MKEEIRKMFESYKAGDIVDVTWDRGNGALKMAFFYFDNNPFDYSPLLIPARNFGEKYSFFDQTDKILGVSNVLRYSPFHDGKFSVL